MKTTIPDQLKADLPQTTWGKILTATPVAMTVIATMLAGLASSEMTKAQYARSLAAQQQSKAGDQWGYFQAKRLRGSMQRSSLDVLRALSSIQPLTPDSLPAASAGARAALLDGQLPPMPPAAAELPALKSALDALEAGRPESEIRLALAPVNDEMLATALRAAQERVSAYDAALKTVNDGVDAVEKSLSGAGPEVMRGFIAARARYTAGRYDAEARLNQSVAVLYELLVRKSNTLAERYQARSQRFFFGMLAAQAAVILSTFSLAARQRSMLWMLAAGAGLAATAFAVYVYLCV